MMITLLAAIFVFGLLIFVHELGHFIFAKLTGMRVDEFAIGFGPKLIGFQYGETCYSLRIFPLGGYNKIAGMDPEEEEDEKSFNKKPLWARALTIFGGSLMNFLLPVILLTIVYAVNGLALNENALGQIRENYPAAQAGLQAGDRIVAIDGQTVDTWTALISIIHESPGKMLTFTVERDGRKFTVPITPAAVPQPSIRQESAPQQEYGVIGIGPVFQKLTLRQSAEYGARDTLLITKEMFSMIGQIIRRRAVGDVAGVVGIARMAGEAAQLGITELMRFAALVSLNLGLINLLPLPVFDGGHIILLILEGVRRKPLQKETQYIIQMIGLGLIATLTALALYNDLMRG